jgi:hypothetical protein
MATNGATSRYLAATHSDHFIIGIDQSIRWLENSDNHQLPENCLLLRSEYTNFWRFAEQAQWRFAKHILLYSNPYPRPKHLQWRWHGDGMVMTLSQAY